MRVTKEVPCAGLSSCITGMKGREGSEDDPSFLLPGFRQKMSSMYFFEFSAAILICVHFYVKKILFTRCHKKANKLKLYSVFY